MIDQTGYAKKDIEEPIQRKGSFVEFDSDESELQAMSSPTKKIKA